MEVLGETTGDLARCLKRQLLLPVSMISPLVGQAIEPYGGHIGSSSADLRRLLLAQAVAAELQAMSVMDDAVEDGVGKGRFADQIVPAVDWDLAGDQRGAAAVTVLDDLQQVVTLLRAERLETPVVEDQQLDAAEGTHQAGVAAVAARQCEIAEQARNALIEHRAIVTAGLVAEGTSKPAFADPSRPFDDQVLRLLDPGGRRSRPGRGFGRDRGRHGNRRPRPPPDGAAG